MYEDEIVEIIELEEDYTIDIEVDKDHLFYANDILTHNSAYNDKSPSLDSVSESLAISQVASTMIAIIGDEQRPDIRTLSIIKSRKVNKSKVKAQNVHIDTDKQKVWDMADNESRRVYLKSEQKEELNTMNKIVKASEVVKDEKDIIKAESKPGGSLLDSLLAK